MPYVKNDTTVCNEMHVFVSILFYLFSFKLYFHEYLHRCAPFVSFKNDVAVINAFVSPSFSKHNEIRVSLLMFHLWYMNAYTCDSIWIAASCLFMMKLLFKRFSISFFIAEIDVTILLGHIFPVRIKGVILVKEWHKCRIEWVT